MLRHLKRLLFCTFILLLLPTDPCDAQEIGVSAYESGFYTDTLPSQTVGYEYESNQSSYSGQNGNSEGSPWFVRLGVASFIFGESATLRANDVVVPGASLRISDETTFAFDIGYQLSPKWTATMTFGVPPELTLDGTGPFEGVTYGTTKYAPAVLALQRHFFLNPRTSVYVGGGVNYTLHYESVDGFVQDLDISNNASAVVQLGIERRLNSRLSLFADAKKAFYETTAVGNVGGAVITSDIKANPTVLFFGVKYDF